MACAQLVENVIGVMEAPSVGVLQRSIQRGVESRAFVVGEVVLVIDRRKQQLRHFEALLVVELHQLFDESLVDRHSQSVGDDDAVVHCRSM